MQGLRLYPKWHNYSFVEPCAEELIAAATERNLLISVPMRVEDYRQRSWLVDIPDVSLAEIGELVKTHPKARFLFVNGSGFSRSALGRNGDQAPANYWIEISRLSALLDNELAQLIGGLGPDRLVFGTGMPFKYPDPPLLKLEVLDASEDVKERIRSGNAAKLIGSKATSQK